MKRISSTLVSLALALAAGATLAAADTNDAAAQASGRRQPTSARAQLDARSGSTTTGKATFKEKNGQVKVTVEIRGATPGTHGIHLHENGDCSAPDATSAGAHFNPHQTMHGAPVSDPHHAGDFGNIIVGANGKGKLTLTMKGLTVASGAQSVVGRSLVVHAAPDDLQTQPSGNSGARIACGVISAQ